MNKIVTLGKIMLRLSADNGVRLFQAEPKRGCRYV
jgi:hypothetical protein